MDNAHHTEVIKEARRVAEAVRGDHNLDYSLESLGRVDEMLGSLGDCGEALTWKAAYVMGCYVGEVLVRQAGAEWTVQEEKEPVFGSTLFVRVNGIEASPITRCFKRILSDSDGIETWGWLLTALASGNVPEDSSDSGDKKVEWQGQGF